MINQDKLRECLRLLASGTLDFNESAELKKADLDFVKMFFAQAGLFLQEENCLTDIGEIFCGMEKGEAIGIMDVNFEKLCPHDKIKIIEDEILPIIFESVKPAANIMSEDEIKINVMQHILLKERPEATELMVSQILAREHIHTIRADNAESEMWIYSEGIYVPQAKTFIKEFIRKVLGEVFTTTFTNQVIAKIEIDTYIEQDKFFMEEDWRLVPVKNGILDIRNLENIGLETQTFPLLPFSPRYKFFSKIPAEYNREKDCPAIKKFFSEILEEADVNVIQELNGFLIVRSYFLKKAVMFLGDGDNGKSILLSLEKTFVGIDNCSAIPLQRLDEDNFCLSELHGKLANICPDLSHEALKNSSNFRSVTGKDMISAARKFLSDIKFVNYAKMLFSANKLPRPYETDISAFFNRWIIITTPYRFLPQKEIETIPENERENIKVADPDIMEKLTTEDELSGLLNYALAGLQRLMQKKDFSYSKSSEDVKNLWIRKADSLSAFLMDEIECSDDTYDEIVAKSDFRQNYGAYCRKHKLQIFGDKHISFVLETTFGVGEAQIEKVRVWKGIKLKNPIQETRKLGFEKKLQEMEEEGQKKLGE